MLLFVLSGKVFGCLAKFVNVEYKLPMTMQIMSRSQLSSCCDWWWLRNGLAHCNFETIWVWQKLRWFHENCWYFQFVLMMAEVILDKVVLVQKVLNACSEPKIFEQSTDSSETKKTRSNFHKLFAKIWRQGSSNEVTKIIDHSWEKKIQFWKILKIDARREYHFFMLLLFKTQYEWIRSLIPDF